MKTALVLGAGGFIGSHLVKRLRSEGYWVRGVDLKYPEFSKSEANEMLIYDLRNPDNVRAVMRLDKRVGEDYNPPFSYLPHPYSVNNPFDEVYQLAADMGGCQYVFTGDHDADILSNSALININVATWSHLYKVKKVFYSSSACMYPQEVQSEYNINGLRESDAYPANPDSNYGWEKLFSERLWAAYSDNYKLDVKIARFHNIYGPDGTYKGGKEKAPASITRKVCEAIIEEENPVIKVWGDGLQTRSFLYIDDCIDAIRLLMQSEYKLPINIGSEEAVSILSLWHTAIEISGYDVKIESIDMPKNYKGVNHRNSNNDLIKQVLNWSPKHTLFQGMLKTQAWIRGKVIEDYYPEDIK